MPRVVNGFLWCRATRPALPAEVDAPCLPDEAGFFKRCRVATASGATCCPAAWPTACPCGAPCRVVPAPLLPFWRASLGSPGEALLPGGCGFALGPGRQLALVVRRVVSCPRLCCLYGAHPWAPQARPSGLGGAACPWSCAHAAGAGSRSFSSHHGCDPRVAEALSPRAQRHPGSAGCVGPAAWHGQRLRAPPPARAPAPPK